jgi:hypothetical protein
MNVDVYGDPRSLSWVFVWFSFSLGFGVCAPMGCCFVMLPVPVRASRAGFGTAFGPIAFGVGPNQLNLGSGRLAWGQEAHSYSQSVGSFCF